MLPPKITTSLRLRQGPAGREPCGDPPCWLRAEWHSDPSLGCPPSSPSSFPFLLFLPFLLLFLSFLRSPSCQPTSAHRYPSTGSPHLAESTHSPQEARQRSWSHHTDRKRSSLVMGKLLIRLLVSRDTKCGKLLAEAAPGPHSAPLPEKRIILKRITKNTFYLVGTVCARACTQWFAWISHWPSFCSEERRVPYEDPGNATGSAHTS